MKYIPLFVALMAVFIFVFPATSMQDTRNAITDCKPQIQMPQGQPQCDCQNAMTAQGNKNCANQPMMNDKQQAPSCPEKGPVGDNCPRSMMDGKQQAPSCPEKGPVGDNCPRSMMNGKQQAPSCPEKGPVGDNCPRSMMDYVVEK